MPSEESRSPATAIKLLRRVGFIVLRLGIYSTVGWELISAWPQWKAQSSATAEQASALYKPVKATLHVQYENYYAQSDGLVHIALETVL